MSPARPAPARSKRPYLRAGDRRRQLLATAATIAGRDGVHALTMAGLAAEAGVSRQLVYEHFSDLPTLVAGLLLDRFAAVDATIADALSQADRPGIDAALFAAREALSLRPEERQILRTLLMTGTSGRNHELAELTAAMRARVIDRWTEIIGSSADPAARALVWAVANAVFGLGDMIDTGTVSVDEAIDELARLLAGAFRG